MSGASFKFRPYLVRLLVILGLSTIFVTLFNEVVYLLQKDQSDRAPKTIELVIPAGAARQVEAGKEVAAIPSEISFVVGDVLEVKNMDDVSHQLGPVWVPPGASARLDMKQAEQIAYTCSFQATRYLGLDVRQPTTLGTRLTALAVAAPTMTSLLFVYSLLVFPIKEKLRFIRQAGGEPSCTGLVACSAAAGWLQLCW